jgi:very-short-patch-repair endonuclease
LIPYHSNLKEPSKELRANMTLAEKCLWERIKARQIKGYRFCRQKPLGGFIVDFYCQKAKIVIEVDGGIHFKKEIHKSDKNKDAYFKSINLNVLRFTNQEIFTDIEKVVTKISNNIPLIPPSKGERLA